MWQDPIVEEIRQIRNEHAKQFDFDLQAIYIALKESEQKSKRKKVSFSPRVQGDFYEKSKDDEIITLTIEEFCQGSKNHNFYSSFAKNEGKFLFDLLMSPESFIKARSATEESLAAIEYLTDDCHKATEKQKSINPEFNKNWHYIKQFIGVVICTLMEANGYRRVNQSGGGVKHSEYTEWAKYIKNITTLTIEEFCQGVKKHSYSNFAENEGKFLFDLLMSPESFIKAKSATEESLPAIAYLAEDCYKAVEEQRSINPEFNKSWGYIKQFIGVVICALMEANGYRKINRTGTVNHSEYTEWHHYIKK